MFSELQFLSLQNHLWTVMSHSSKVKSQEASSKSVRGTSLVLIKLYTPFKTKNLNESRREFWHAKAFCFDPFKKTFWYFILKCFELCITCWNTKCGFEPTQGFVRVCENKIFLIILKRKLFQLMFSVIIFASICFRNLRSEGEILPQSNFIWSKIHFLWSVQSKPLYINKWMTGWMSIYQKYSCWRIFHKINLYSLQVLQLIQPSEELNA